eukprot:TRINITY_DN19451_c0_g1_i2.p1 TRINITY_DN19451_c0_g1~~TRINITY_DN19451_c0_g1_i2.p1  ORF type:complete len:496 (-),score=79.48 TRINITY_DN19451_c0_g1_i2:79-1515(-)
MALGGPVRVVAVVLVILALGHLLAVNIFLSDKTAPRTCQGTRPSECSNQCSMHGICLEGTCYCQGEYWGKDCSHDVRRARRSVPSDEVPPPPSQEEAPVAITKAEEEEEGATIIVPETQHTTPPPAGTDLQPVVGDAVLEESGVTVLESQRRASYQLPFEIYGDVNLRRSLADFPEDRRFKHPGKPGFETLYIAMIRHGFVGEEGYVCDAKRRFVLGGCSDASVGGSVTSGFTHPVSRHKKLVTVVQKWGNIGIHMFFETLPRIARAGVLLQKDPDLQLLTFTNRFLITLMERMGIDESRIVPFHASWVFYAEELYIVSPTVCGRPRKEDIEALRSVLAPQPPTVEVNTIALLPKEIRNHDRLRASLEEEFGANVVVVPAVTEDTIDEVANMIGKAQVVLCGYGMTSGPVLFASPEALILEVQSLTANTPTLWVAKALGATYAFVQDKSANASPVQAPIPNVIEALRDHGFGRQETLS